MPDATKTAPAPKPGILDIAPYVGGKGAIAGFAEPMKLSSNENALGAGEKAREAYAAALKNIHVYPDGRATKLRDAVAAHHGLEPERLIFGNGSDEVFALLNQAYLSAGDNIVTGQYGFLAYRISAKACGAEVKLAAEPDFRADVDAMLGLVDERTKLVYLSNPANPTGSFATGEEIRRLHAGLPPHVILVIDEAYAEFVTEPDWESAFDLARTAPNIVVTRTFSKLHGLGGLRALVGSYPGERTDYLRQGALAQRLERLLGPDYAVLLRNLGTSGPLVQEGDLLYITGNQPHEGVDEQAAVVVDPAQNALRVWLVHAGAEQDRLDPANASVAWPRDVLTMQRNRNELRRNQASNT